MRRFAESGIAAVLALLCGACGGSSGSPGKSAPPYQVRPARNGHAPEIELTPEAEKRLGIKTTVVERRTEPRTRLFAGEIIAPPGGLVVLDAPLGGALRAAGGSPVRPGGRVSAGQTLFLVAPVDRDLGGEAAQELVAARAQAETARARRQRTETLLHQGATSQRALEEAGAAQVEAEAALSTAERRHELLGETADGSGIRVQAPFDGVVVSQQAVPGQVVTAGTPLVSVARMSAMWVRVPVFAGERSELRLYEPASMRPMGANDAPARPITPVDGPPTAEPLSSTVDLYFAVGNDDQAFRLGERVDVRIPCAGEDAAMVVPWAALVIDPLGGRWVYAAVGPHSYARRRVEVRAVVDEVAVLSKGPEAGTVVVVEGAAELFGAETGVGH